MRAVSVERDERKSLPLGDVSVISRQTLAAHTDCSSGLMVSQTEDAVIKLESVAFDQRLPGSRYRPVDSLPFFDNIPNSRIPSSSHSSSHRREASVTASNEADYSALELTRERTSILAFPLSFEGPFSGPSLGLPLVSSVEDLKAAKARELEGIFKLCPDKELSHRLVNRYFVEVRSKLSLLFCTRDHADSSDSLPCRSTGYSTSFTHQSFKRNMSDTGKCENLEEGTRSIRCG